jgi:hypothetical protein
VSGTSGHPAIGITAVDHTSGWAGVGEVSVAAITGHLTDGISADRTGITPRVIGNAEGSYESSRRSHKAALRSRGLPEPRFVL